MQTGAQTYEHEPTQPRAHAHAPEPTGATATTSNSTHVQWSREECLAWALLYRDARAHPRHALAGAYAHAYARACADFRNTTNKTTVNTNVQKHPVEKIYMDSRKHAQTRSHWSC